MLQICLWYLLYKRVDYWGSKKIEVEFLMHVLKGVREIRSYSCLFSTIDIRGREQCVAIVE
jgi:hypothetical protein